MEEHIEQQGALRRPRIARKLPGTQAAEVIRRLLQIVVYDKACPIGGTLTLNDLADTSDRSVTGR